MILLILYRLIYFPLLIVAGVARFFNPKIKKGFELRKKKQGQPPWTMGLDQATEPLWFHCSSGEFEYAKPIIRKLKSKYPQQKILVTYFSPSVEKSIKDFKEVDFFCPTPWDTLGSWQEFIDFHKPKALLIARTDLWPMMLLSAKKNNIPSLLFSKTQSAQPGFFSRLLQNQLLKMITDIFCVSEDDLKLVNNQLGPSAQVHKAGDTRYDQCVYRMQHPKHLKNLNNFFRPLFLAASTWPQDEEWIIPLIKKNQIDTSFIIAPHEPTPEHLKALSYELQKRGLKASLYSKTVNWDPREVLIIDQVGILADLYSWTRFSFIGGSVSRSVHSVMESLAFGNLTFVGPRHHNNREALSFKETSISGITPVQTVKSSLELIDLFEKYKKTWTDKHQLDLRLAVNSKCGASDIVIRWIEDKAFKKIN